MKCKNHLAKKLAQNDSGVPKKSFIISFPAASFATRIKDEQKEGSNETGQQVNDPWVQLE